MSENWTTTLPTVSGWYWLDYEPLEIVQIDDKGNVWFAAEEGAMKVKDFEGRQWSGLIEPPPREKQP